MTSQTAAVGPAPTTFGAEPLALTWKQQSGLIGVSIVNFLLTILTLGIYQFWGKTEVRRRIWSSVRLNDEPLEYTGTGWELFVGFLLVFFAIFLPVSLGYTALLLVWPRSLAVVVAQPLLFIAFFFLMGVAIHRAMRYRLARTRWRGIRGGLEGSSLGYAWTHFWTALLIPLTLGWIMPWRAVRLQGRLTSDMRFGDRPFHFKARSGPLYGRFAILWICGVLLLIVAGSTGAYVQYLAMTDPRLASPVPGEPNPLVVGYTVVMVFAVYIILGLMMAWYMAAKFNHFAAHTQYEGATFRGNATGWSLIWLGISNMLIVMLTLGLLAPVAQARAARYMVDRLTIEGAVPLAEILQRSEDPTRGEGLAQVFDVDAF